MKLLYIFEQKSDDKEEFVANLSGLVGTYTERGLGCLGLEWKLLYGTYSNGSLDREQKHLFNYLYASCPLDVAKNVSKAERRMKELTEKSLIYGEVEYDPFLEILKKVRPSGERGGIFYDLGSGAGRPVFIARLTMDFDSCIGIEYLKGLHDKSSAIKSVYDEEILPILYPDRTKGRVEFYHSKFQDFDWSDGDVCFANSTCFDDALLDQLSDQAEKLKPGSIIITFTKELTSRQFEILDRKRYQMSWGPATVYVHRRLGSEKFVSALPAHMKDRAAHGWSTCSNISSNSSQTL